MEGEKENRKRRERRGKGEVIDRLNEVGERGRTWLEKGEEAVGER